MPAVTTALATPQHWEGDIQKFEAAESAQPVAPGGVVFVGSSSIRMWTTLAQDFPGVPLINRGFGGSELSDSVFFAPRLILTHQPRLVVVSAGDNDIAGGIGGFPSASRENPGGFARDSDHLSGNQGMPGAGREKVIRA